MKIYSLSFKYIPNGVLYSSILGQTVLKPDQRQAFPMLILRNLLTN